MMLLLLGGCPLLAQPVRVAPDCCSQAIEYKEKYLLTKAILDQTRQAGDEIAIEKDKRIERVRSEGNDKLKAQNGTIGTLSGIVTLTRDTLAKSRALLVVRDVTIVRMQQENETWVPKTKVGRIWRGYVLPGLAAVGAAAIALRSVGR